MKLEAVDYQSPTAAKDFVESLRQTGFGVLKNHPIAQEKVASIYQNWQAFFNTEAKSDYVYNKGTQDGFFPQSVSEVAKGFKKKDIKEYYHYYPWGQCPQTLKEEISDYYQSTSKLARELLDWIEQESPEEVSKHYREPLSNMIKDSDQTLLRILHYPPLQGDEEPDAIRAAAHEDINLITLLPAANEPGLQVKTMDGEWLDVPSDFGNLIVNIGDMLQEASGHYFPSTTHRVVNPQGADTTKSRISLPLFLHPDPKVVLSDKYTAGSYLQERLKELGVV
jgi:isopenicillin N synthase-like dioxygenase